MHEHYALHFIRIEVARLPNIMYWNRVAHVPNIMHETEGTLVRGSCLVDPQFLDLLCPFVLSLSFVFKDNVVVIIILLHS